MGEKLCQSCEEEGLGCFFKHMRKLTSKQPANSTVSRRDILKEIVEEGLKRNCPYIPNLLVKRFSKR
jgi:hypothetical protein